MSKKKTAVAAPEPDPPYTIELDEEDEKFLARAARPQENPADLTFEELSDALRTLGYLAGRLADLVESKKGRSR